MELERPLALLLGPLAALVLWLLERWRRRPPRVVVADLALFQDDPDVQAEARSSRRRAGARWLLRGAAALLLAGAIAGPRLQRGPGGPLLLDLVLDRGLDSDLRDEGGRPRLTTRVAALEQVLDRLGREDRVRLHLLPAGLEPPHPPLSPGTAREVLRRATSAGASAALERALAGLSRPEGPPVFLGADRWVPGVEAAGGVSPARPPRDRAIVSLLRDEAGRVWVTVLSRAAGGPVEVELRARRAEGGEVVRERRAELPLTGQVLVAFEPGELPPEPLLLEARLRGADDLPLDDAAFAVRRVRARRVGLVGDPGPWVRRALRAVEGVELVELARRPDDRAGLDLLVDREQRAEQRLPEVPLVLIPAELRDAGGGVLEGLAHPLLPRTLEALASETVTLRGADPLPALPGMAPLLRLAGGKPVAGASGSGRRLVIAFGFPLRRAETTWTELPSFPLFWAELLQAIAPGGGGELVAHPVGTPWEGPEGTLVPLVPGVVRDADGRPLLGCVAAPLPPPADGPVAPERFAPETLARIEAARPREAERPLAPWFLLAAALLLLAVWRS